MSNIKGNQLDLNKVIASLSRQVSHQAIEIAEREALIEEIGQELKDTKKELKELQKKQIKEMDKDTE